jgi:hypothetical protein
MNRQLKEISEKSYIATAPFHTNFFTYTTSTNPSTFEKQGDLSVVNGATSGTCPAGRILRENGRRLFPGAHPINTLNGSPVTFPPSTMMVGVFDNQSMLNGFIDVNSPIFAPYNSDRPNYLKDAVDPVAGLTDRGAPVYTNGSADILGNLNVTANTRLYGTLRVDGDTTANGRLILNSGNTGFSELTGGTIQGSFRKLTVNASLCRTTSVVMLTYAGQNEPGFLSAEAIGNGSFQIV